MKRLLLPIVLSLLAGMAAFVFGFALEQRWLMTVGEIAMIPATAIYLVTGTVFVLSSPIAALLRLARRPRRRRD